MLDILKKSTLFFILFFAVLIAVSGCTTAGQVSDKAHAIGAKVNDSALEAAESVICGDVSEKSIIRKYGHNSERARARRIFCGYPEELLK